MFSNKLKEKRTQLGLTQSQLAENIYVSRSLVAKWEQGLALPTKSSLMALCALFSCTENELLDYDDVDKNLQHNKKNRRTLIIVLVLVGAIALSATGVGIYFGVKSSDQGKDNYTIKSNEFFSDSILKSSGLYDMPKISLKAGSDSFLANYYSSSQQYVATIDNRQVFDAYMDNIYQYLRGNPYISSLSSALDHPEDNYRNGTTGCFSQNFNTYLLPMNTLSEFAKFPFENNDSYVDYCFYFVKDLSSSHQAYSSVDPYKVEVNYYSELTNIVGLKKGDEEDFTYAKGNFSISIVHLESSHSSKEVSLNSGASSVSLDTFNYYLCSERYDIKRIEISNDNYASYLPIEERTDGTDKVLWLSKGNLFSPYYRLDLEADYQYTKDSELIKGTKAFSMTVGYPFHYFQLPDDSTHSYSEITLSNIKTTGGYFYQLERKENAPDPYPDRENYL